jgi:hypothetical protein
MVDPVSPAIFVGTIVSLAFQGFLNSEVGKASVGTTPTGNRALSPVPNFAVNPSVQFCPLTEVFKRTRLKHYVPLHASLSISTSTNDSLFLICSAACNNQPKFTDSFSIKIPRVDRSEETIFHYQCRRSFTLVFSNWVKIKTNINLKSRTISNNCHQFITSEN